MKSHYPTAGKEWRPALYARVSSKQQAEANTIASQLEALQARIGADGLELEPELSFIDEATAAARCCGNLRNRPLGMRRARSIRNPDHSHSSPIAVLAVSASADQSPVPRKAVARQAPGQAPRCRSERWRLVSRPPCRRRALADRFEEEPRVNPNTRTREFSLRDPDGYYVTISALP